MAYLEVESLTKRFRGLVAVDGVTFSVDRGQIVAIIGPNGAGKTTTFNLISGLFPADAGSIRLDGRDLTALPAHRRCHLGVARTFQVMQPFEEMTATENVMVGALFGQAGGVALGPARAAAERLLDLVELGDKSGWHAASLTLADRKRLEIARALATAPRLLLLDEIMEGLTPTEIRDAIALVRRVRDEGVTIVLIEHEMGTVRELSEHVVVMDYGRKLSEGRYAEVSRDPRVIEAYLGREDDGDEGDDAANGEGGTANGDGLREGSGGA